MVLNTIREADLKNKRVLIRVDFNVPLKDGKVTDATRIVAALPTINYILSQPGASLVVMSHFGRPKGKKNPDFSMVPVGKKFEELLGKPVKVASDVIGPEVKKEVEALKPGEVPFSRTAASILTKRPTILSSPRSLPLTVTSM